MNTKVYLDIQNLPETLNGDYIVVSSIKDEGLWFYGCFKDKNRAQRVAEDCINGFVVEIAKESFFTNDYKSESERLQQKNSKLQETYQIIKDKNDYLREEMSELRKENYDLQHRLNSLIVTFRTIIAR